MIDNMVTNIFYITRTAITLFLCNRITLNQISANEYNVSTSILPYFGLIS
jgi:hypothetical protein